MSVSGGGGGGKWQTPAAESADATLDSLGCRAGDAAARAGGAALVRGRIMLGRDDTRFRRGDEGMGGGGEVVVELMRKLQTISAMKAKVFYGSRRAQLRTMHHIDLEYHYH
jgi:hypothetical protein